jgi:ssDNA-binding Zn-finger/Zn-ribbon topoisomerase 1
MVKTRRYRSGNVDVELEKGELISEIPGLSIGTPVGICPKCGEELVIRGGKNGKFIGCKGFNSKGCKNTYKIVGFKAITKLEISFMRDRRLGHGFEMHKILHIRE